MTQGPDAVRLDESLRGVFQTLLRTLVGVGWEPCRRAAGPPEDTAMCVLGMVTTPGEFTPARRRSGARLEIDCVNDLESLEEARQVAVGGNGPGPLSAMYVPEVVAIPGVKIYVGRVEGEPVTTAIGWTANAATGIFQVATAPASRGRGYGAAVTSRAVLDGFAAGADLAWLQASGPGERLYRSLGFRQVETPESCGKSVIPLPRMAR
jgi:hypothetical protein